MDGLTGNRPVIVVDHQHVWTPWVQSGVFVKGILARTCLLPPCEEVEYNPEPPIVRELREYEERMKHGRP